MSWKETIVWTVLPNGRRGQDLRITVFVAPRLQTDQVQPGKTTPVLSQFPHFLHWPATLAGITFKLRFAGGLALDPLPDPDSEGIDPSLWTTLFSPDTPVERFQFPDLHLRKVRSFHAREIESFITQRYRRFAFEAPTVFPQVETLLDRELGFGEVAFEPGGELGVPGFTQEQLGQLARERGLTTQQVAVQETKRQVMAELNPAFAGGRTITRQQLGTLRPMTHPMDAADAPAPLTPVRAEFLQLKLFHLPRSVKPLPRHIQPPEVDFHRMLTALAQHPRMLRRLGLAIDLVVPLGGQNVAATGSVWVQPQWSSPPTPSPDAPCRTQYAYSASGAEALGFVARPKAGSDLMDRFLKLGDPEYSLIQLDVDGAAQKAMILADQANRTRERRGKQVEENVSLPSLRSAGVSLVRDDRAERTAQLFAARRSLNDTLEGAGDPVVWADDLIRGYRVDVLDGTVGTWRTLCARETSFATKTGSPLATDQDEGWVSLATTQSTDPTEEGGEDLYVHEALCRWGGWSLVTPRPGKHLDENHQPSSAGNEPSTAMNLKITTGAAKGSLPRLRFGHPYRLRARAVDLAGNGLSLAQADELTTGARAGQVATDNSFVYRRYEPLAQPVVVLRRPLSTATSAPPPRPVGRGTRPPVATKTQLSPGETVERLVIRSYNSSPELDDNLSSETSERHIAPPQAAELTAETHGAFDVAGKLQCSAYATIISKEGGFGEGAYDTDQLALPYLPDPPARGAALAGLPGSSGVTNRVTRCRADGVTSNSSIAPGPTPPVWVHQIDFGAPTLWPELRPFRLKVVGCIQPRDPQWHAAARELEVFLPPGETTRVKLSSYLDAADLDAMALWQWLKEDGKAATLEKQVLAGLHWMLTPSRELVLVHAVQQPLVVPAFRDLRPYRKRGEPFAILADSFPISGKSTVQLDILGSWVEPVDNGVPGEPPRLVEGKARAFELPVDYDDTQVKFGPERKLQFMPSRAFAQVQRPSARPAARGAARPVAAVQARPVDTAQARTTARPVAASRPTIGVAAARPELLAALGEREVAARTLTVSRHHFGDTRHRDVDYTAVATTRYREYLPFTDQEIAAAEQDPASTRRITRTSQPRTVDIPSAARPAAPRVAYVIPTFGWERGAGAGGPTSRRTGGGLRVYLERPWFSSGAGELLGVVVAPPPSTAPALLVRPPVDPAIVPYVTQWALDPVWRSAPTSTQGSPPLASFRNPRRTESGLSLDELPGARVDVAGFVVGEWDTNGVLTGYDPDRELWFSDIEIDPGDSYYPFVRLALVRYQPSSVVDASGDVKLSRVVVTDFAQLAPDRFASVTFNSDTQLTVAVSGHTYAESWYDTHRVVASVARPNVGLTREQLATTGPQPQVPRSATLPAADSQQPTATAISVQRPMTRRPGVLGLAAPTGGGSVEVSLEMLPEEGGGDLSWTLVEGSPVALSRAGLVGQGAAWTGKVNLPEPRGTRRYRLVIKEYEWFAADGPNEPAEGQIVRPGAARLVYADVMEL